MKTKPATWELRVTFATKNGISSMTVGETHTNERPDMELREIRAAIDKFNGFFADAKLSVEVVRMT